MPARRPVKIGSTFDRLTVVSTAPSIERAPGHFTYRVNVRCQCGSHFVVDERSLRNNNTTSCGCKTKERAAAGINTRHGLCYTPTYEVWREIKKRCFDTKNMNYGGRGISICRRWQTFENFLADMGERPDGLTIERINNNRGYSPANCRWATYAEQSRNTRQNKFVVICGKRLCLTDAAIELGINRGSIPQRARTKNISLQQAANYYAAKRR